MIAWLLNMRVVSLLPSATETLAFIGGEDLLVGRSHECDYPQVVQILPALTSGIKFQDSKQVHDEVGVRLSAGKGLYGIDQQKLRELNPDVILTQSLCSVCSVDISIVQDTVKEFERVPKIVDMNPGDLIDVIEDCKLVGQAVGLEKEAALAQKNLLENLHALIQQAKDLKINNGNLDKQIVFFEWVEPFFIGGHWTPQLIHLAGGTHPLNQPQIVENHESTSTKIQFKGAGKSIQMTSDQVKEVQADFYIICPCGLDLKTTEQEVRNHLINQEWFKLSKTVQSNNVVLVDGNQMFNRPGPRLIEALQFLIGLFWNKPELIPKDFPWKRLELD